MTASERPFTVAVAGFAAVDCLLLKNKSGTADIANIPGGSLLIQQILSDANYTVLGGGDIPTPFSSQARTIIRRLEWFRKDISAGEKDPKVVRVASTEAHQNAPQAGRLPDLKANPSVLVLDMREMSLFTSPEGKAWVQALAQRMTEPNAPELVILAGVEFYSESVGHELHELLLKGQRKITMVVQASALREAGVYISRGLSWERTALDFLNEFKVNPRLYELRLVRQAIVIFAQDGAIMCGGSDKPTLVYDPMGIEGLFEEGIQGTMFGANTVALAELIQMLDRPLAERIQAVKSALVAMRHVLSAGLDAKSFRLVHKAVAEDPSKKFGHVELPESVAANRDWSIAMDIAKVSPLEKLAESIVVNGEKKALESSAIRIPVGKVGVLTSMDRMETENLRAIYQLVKAYDASLDAKRPLSIAVFGAPGAGKSFGVKQVITSIIGKGKTEFIELNLSQAPGYQTLVETFHAVRNACLAGKMPVMFFDEFDSALGSEELGWLKFFLAPMQDGLFREGSALHPVGKAIFVFAGGTCSSYEAFANREGDEILKFKNVKGPDFVSRLKGYINVLGPNPVHRKDKTSIVPATAMDDPPFILRRALFLTGMLKGKVLQDDQKRTLIDNGVLHALLTIPQYRHGARSIETIIQMSSLDGTTRFTRSHLPDRNQLELHVDSEKFYALSQSEFSGSTIDTWAEVIHDNYCKGQMAKGWKYGDTKDEKALTNPLLKPFAELTDFVKESNRDQARAIPLKLRSLNLGLRKAVGEPQPFVFSKELIDQNLDKLTRLEHDRWCSFYLLNGWEYAEKRDDQSKKHNLLVPFEKLTPKEIYKDSQAILDIPAVIATTGHEVVKL